MLKLNVGSLKTDGQKL